MYTVYNANSLSFNQPLSDVKGLKGVEGGGVGGGNILIVKFICIKNIHFYINISIRLFTFNFFSRYSISFCKHSSFPRTKLKWGGGY